MGTDGNRRSTDDVIMSMASDIGFIKGSMVPLVKQVTDNTNDIEELKGARKTTRGFLIGATVLAGSAGSALHTAISKVLEHLP